jgi:sec-independent protein translocase protein TatB
MFGINGGEALILLLIAVVLVGPERLPSFAEQLARWVRAARGAMSTTRARVEAELGEEIDWASLDPRRYDPRRIVRDAFAEGPDRRRPRPPAASWSAEAGPAPFDDEAT